MRTGRYKFLTLGGLGFLLLFFGSWLLNRLGQDATRNRGFQDPVTGGSFFFGGERLHPHPESFPTRFNSGRAWHVSTASFQEPGNEREGVPESPSTSADSTELVKRIPLDGPRAEAFLPFADRVHVEFAETHLVVESDGMPAHNMMVGIRSWQQQVPLPQPFRGENAWRIPLKPTPAPRPLSVLQEPLRGAIALAVNGVPIFCALNNRGEDTFLAGELDHWGGHCGRGDDYHYHIAPVHLEQIVGRGNPIAYALDGYPILGMTEADGTVPQDLDPFNGHRDRDGNYHYHATSDFPYVNGGLVGKVTLDGDQVKQPRDSPVRPPQSPLKGATITHFHRDGNRFEIRYGLESSEGSIDYVALDDERFEFHYANPDGTSWSRTYQRSRSGSTVLPRLLWLVVPASLALVGLSIVLVSFRRRR